MYRKPSVRYILRAHYSWFSFTGKKIMSINTSPRCHLSETEGFAHIESYYRSGICPSEYYKQHNLSEHQFYNWRRRYLAAHPEFCESHTGVSRGKKRFHEVKIEKLPSSPSPQSLCGLEIHYPHGVKVFLSGDRDWDIATLCSLIKLGG
jgi:hypothetical protein